MSDCLTDITSKYVIVFPFCLNRDFLLAVITLLLFEDCTRLALISFGAPSRLVARLYSIVGTKALSLLIPG